MQVIHMHDTFAVLDYSSLLLKPMQESPLCLIFDDTVKPVYNDHLYDKIYPLWFIQ